MVTTINFMQYAAAMLTARPQRLGIREMKQAKNYGLCVDWDDAKDRWRADARSGIAIPFRGELSGDISQGTHSAGLFQTVLH